MSMLDAALALAELGYAVFPLAPREKVPLGGHGCKDATHEPATIRAAWRSSDCNVGIAAGAVSDVLVLDVDGDDGRQSLAALEAVHGALPPTVECVTARGRHVYLRYPGAEVEIGNSAGKLAEGLDVRTDGGYVVAPPSIHPSGDRYRWADGRAPGEVVLAPMPDWLLERLVRRPEPAPAYTPRTEVYTGETRYGLKALEDECARLAGAAEGSRNSTLNEVAFRVGQLVLGGHLRESSLGDVRAAARACGLKNREIEQTVRSGYAGGQKKPSTTDPDPHASRETATAGAAERPPPPGDEDAPGVEPSSPPAPDRAPQAPAVRVYAAHEVAQHAVNHLTDSSRRRAPKTGYRVLDEAIGGLPPGSMLTIGGRRGSSKSSLLLGMAMNQSRDGQRIGIVSCEDPEWVWGARLLCALEPDHLTMSAFFSAPVAGGLVERARRAAHSARDYGIHFAFKVGDPIRSVLGAVHQLIADGCHVIMVDYLQAIAAPGKERYIARTDDAVALKGACSKAGRSLVLASQMSRPEKHAAFKEPTDGELKDTGDLENMSEAIILLWNSSDAEDAENLGKVSKVKWGASRPRFKVQRHSTSGALVGLEQDFAKPKKSSRLPDGKVGFAPPKQTGFGHA